MQESLNEFKNILPGEASRVVDKAISGNFDFSVKELLFSLVKTLLGFMSENAGLVVTVFAVAVACALCLTAADPDQPPWNESLLIAVGLCVSVPLASAFHSCITSAYVFFDDMEAVNLSVIPALLTVAVPIKTGIFLTVAQLMINLMRNVFLPTAVIFGVFKLCSITGDRFGLGKISDTIKSFFNWGLGIVMMVFSVITAGAGLANGMSLSLAVKTIQHTAGAAVPVVGQYLSQSANAVATGASLIKGAAGMGAVAFIGTVCITPFLNMLSFMFLFKIAGILIKPLIDGRIAGVVDGIGEGVSMIMATVALMSVFSFLNVAAIAGAGVGRLMKEWLVSVIVISVILSLVSSLLPDNSLKRSSLIAFGFVFLLVILSPLVKVIREGIPTDILLFQSISETENSGENGYISAVAEDYEKRLINQCNSILKEKGFNGGTDLMVKKDADSDNFGEILWVKCVVNKGNEEVKQGNVEKIVIDLDGLSVEYDHENDGDKKTEKVKSVISEYLGIEKEKVYVEFK